MFLFIRYVVFYLFLMTTSQLSQAVQGSGPNVTRPNSIDTSSTVERGGLINSVNLKEGSMVIDGVAYVFSKYPIKIHAGSVKNMDRSFELKAGMQIRFSTSSENWSAQVQVREIWVTSIDGKPTGE